VWMSVTVLVGLVVAIAAGLELAARAWLRRDRYYVNPPGLRLLMHTDRERMPELEPIVRFCVNREGERGSEVPRPAPGETLYRILVAGGSQPEGYLLDQDTQWPGALQTELSRPDRLRRLGATRVHVGNVARSGVGSQGLDLMLERLLPAYSRLQVIIVLVGASDVLRWLEEGAPTTPPRARVDDIFKCHPGQRFGWKPQSLAMGELTRRWRRRLPWPVKVHYGAGKWYRDAAAMRARAKVLHRTAPDPTGMLDHFEVHFRSLIHRATAHADRVIVVRQPWFAKDTYLREELARFWHGGVGQAWRQQVTDYYSIEATAALMTLLDRRAARLAWELGVEQIDLMPVLEPSLWHFYDFFHATPAASRVIAQQVAGAILQERPAEAREPARHERGHVVRAFQGQMDQPLVGQGMSRR
jgi:lysophospholipase L1-like esterase